MIQTSAGDARLKHLDDRYGGLEFRVVGNKPNSRGEWDVGVEYKKTKSTDLPDQNKGAGFGFSTSYSWGNH